MRFSDFVENEDYDALPGHEEDFGGQARYFAQQEERKLNDPAQLAQLKAQLLQSMNASEAIRDLWILFKDSRPMIDPRKLFIAFSELLKANAQNPSYANLDGLDPEWLQMYQTSVK